MDMSSALANQAADLVAASQRCTIPRRVSPKSSPSSIPYPTHRQAPHSHLSNAEQLAILRDAFAKNPNAGKQELEELAEKTGRTWEKIREYFRQRRNKQKNTGDLGLVEEPGRATAW